MPAYSDMSIRDWYAQMEEILGDVLEHQDFSMQTWLALGAAFQLFALAWLPSRLSFWFPLAWLAYRLTRTALDSWNPHRSKLWSRIKRGRWMGQLPEPENPSEATETSEGVVIFLLGARLNHPLGKLGPGAVEVNEVFNDMWREAEQNRSKWGYLKGLQKFSEGTAHRLGQNMYNSKKLPFIGIMHEAYYAPKGCWETIYDNMPPWGLGKYQPGTVIFELMIGNIDWMKLTNGTAKIPGNVDSRDTKAFELLTPSPRGSTMFRRMGRAKDGTKLSKG
ncbi:MAG: hypothetical protein Q9197_003581 [Variospora fuerteventurae]